MLSTTTYETPNQAFIDCWNQVIAPKVQRFDYLFKDGAAAHGREALGRHPVAAGERVLDVGCGFGDSTVELAELVGRRGEAVGIDVVGAFLDFGRQLATRCETSNASFLLADAQTHRFEPEYDVLFSRFGTMFFANPVAAMRNLRGALVPGGRLVATAWRTIDDNPWLSISKRLATEIMPPLPPEPDTCGPGPFSWASPNFVRLVLTTAGFEDVRLTPITTSMLVGRDMDEAIEMLIALGPAGELVREAGDEGVRRLPALKEALADVLTRCVGDDGIRLASSSWCITASSPLV